jgi:hypothetical protein
MSIWAVATEMAIWTLIGGSLAVFAWFLVEVIRLAKADTGAGSAEDGDGAAGDT